MAVVAPLATACSDPNPAPAADQTGASGAHSDDSDATDETTTAAGDDTGLRWARANLGFVSAYVLSRGNRAAIVDTGVAGSADAIGRSLADLGLTFDDVDHVILTHHHADHVGSMAEVVSRTAGATVHAGLADLEAVAAGGGDRMAADEITGLVGGEDLFGLEALPTPGHTPGHMAVIDHDAGLLVAGDAIFSADGGVIEGPERFFDDVSISRQTIRDLAQLSFNTLLVGHGDPIEEAADTAVAALASSLP